MKKMRLVSLAALSAAITLYGAAPAWAETDSTTPVITAGSASGRPAPASDQNSRQTATAVITAGTIREDRGPGAYHWEQDERGWYYQNYNGDYAKDEWRLIRGVWYSFDSEGYMRSNAWVDTGGIRYRVGEDGGMLKSQTITVDGISYDLDDTGAVVAAPRTEEELQAEAMAAGIVASITNDTMDKRQKAAAIYQYVRGRMTYSYGGPGPESGEGAAALYGFRRHTGNCFEYYAISKFMLEAAGMPSIRVVRASDNDHFWNLVNVDGAWYHFDTTPRRVGNDTWCLVTTGYLARSWNAHNFDTSAYPATP